VFAVARAIAQDVSIAGGNRAFGESGLARVPDIVAANWVRLHTDPKDIIAAPSCPACLSSFPTQGSRFAPIVRSEVLMEGFRRLNIRYVIVIDRDHSYYLPSDEDCFEIVEKAYPNVFRLAAKNRPSANLRSHVHEHETPRPHRLARSDSSNESFPFQMLRRTHFPLYSMR